MPKFKPYNYKQTAMIALNYEDQLQAGTFEYALHYLMEHKIDLSVFYPRYQNDDNGRPAYNPAILLKIILFAYSKGITSSREIQWCCEHNIIFKALSCDTVPHFTTIASFVSDRGDEIADLFEQILLICDQQGLLGNELFAIDGCKLPSNAAKEWSGTLKELEQKRDKIYRQIRYYMKQHQKQDQSESRDEARVQRTQQSIDTLNKAFERIDDFLKTSQPRMGKGKIKREVKSNITDHDSAKMTTSHGTIQGYTAVAAVDKKHQVIVHAQAFGEGQEHFVLQPVLNDLKDSYQRLGISDNIYHDGVTITADTGYANEANMQYLYEQGINGYIPDNKFRSRDEKFTQQKEKYGHHKGTSDEHYYAPSDFTFDPIAKTCQCPAGKLLSLRHESTDNHNNHKLFFEGRLLQCRHCEQKHRCMKNPAAADHRKGNGRQVSFILEKRREANYTDWMKQRVDSDQGKQIYSHRMSVVEPVFANICANKGLKRFSLRSKKKVQGQWQLYCMVHNIEKLANYGRLAT